jgi:hypothetical protein
MNKVNVIEKFAQVDGYWNPAVVGALNGPGITMMMKMNCFMWSKAVLSWNFVTAILH